MAAAALVIARRLAPRVARPLLVARPLSTTPGAVPGLPKGAQVFDATAANFSSEILHAPTPVVLDCYADWCEPCKTLAPLLLKEVEKHDGKVALACLDVDKERRAARQGGRQKPLPRGSGGALLP